MLQFISVLAILTSANTEPVNLPLERLRRADAPRTFGLGADEKLPAPVSLNGTGCVNIGLRAYLEAGASPVPAFTARSEQALADELIVTTLGSTKADEACPSGSVNITITFSDVAGKGKGLDLGPIAAVLVKGIPRVIDTRLFTAAYAATHERPAITLVGNYDLRVQVTILGKDSTGQAAHWTAEQLLRITYYPRLQISWSVHGTWIAGGIRQCRREDGVCNTPLPLVIASPLSAHARWSPIDSIPWLGVGASVLIAGAGATLSDRTSSAPIYGAWQLNILDLSVASFETNVLLGAGFVYSYAHEPIFTFGLSTATPIRRLVE